MGVEFFGQYLLEKNIITAQELIEAVEYQESQNLKIGDYAIAKGFLTYNDIEKIQNEQKRVDMMFGELAKKLNILTTAQVKEILTLQQNDHILIGEALVEKNFITRDVMERELAIFKEQQGKYDTGEIRTPEGVKNHEIIKEFVNVTHKLLQRFAHLNIKIGDGYISANEPSENFLLISILFSGNFKYEYALSTSKEISELITSGIIGEDIKEETSLLSEKETKEIISDGMKEFCNIVCGNIIAKLAQKGKTLDIHPPNEIESSSDRFLLLNGRKAVYYPFLTAKGDINLIILEGN